MTNKIIIAITAVIFTFSTYAQSTAEIISKHIEAIGGVKNWSNLKSLRQTGKIKMQGAEITITTSQIDQKAYRTDIAVMGMNGYTFFTTTEGWMFMPFQGQTVPEPMTPEDVKMSQDQLDIQNDFNRIQSLVGPENLPKVLRLYADQLEKINTLAVKYRNEIERQK